MPTYASALALVGADVPAHLVADAEVPVLTGAQAQGDLLVFPATATGDGAPAWGPVPDGGVQLVRGEATGNTHWLHRGLAADGSRSEGVRWAPAPAVRTGPGTDPADDGGPPLALGLLHVPEGGSALLIHTDEHGANAIGPGSYAIHRKREAAVQVAGERLVQAQDAVEAPAPRRLAHRLTSRHVAD